MQHLPHVKTCLKIICTPPHVKKQALTQRSYAHAYKTQTSLSLHATSSTREEASSCPKIICTYLQPRLASLYVQHLPDVKKKVLAQRSYTHFHMKKQALTQRSYAHAYKTQTSLSLHATSSTREETSPHPKIICTCLQNPD